MATDKALRPLMRILAGAAVLVTACAANAQLYRWTDPSGRVHFTDTPPPPTAKDVQKKRGGPGPSSPAVSNDPYVLQLARKNAPVTLYTAPGCKACESARKLLNERGVPFKEVSVVNETAAAELTKAVGGTMVPAIVVGTNSQMGFEQGAYQGLLDAGGYPKTGLLPPNKPAPTTAAAGGGAPPPPPR